MGARRSRKPNPKRSRDATPKEIFPGAHHGPLQPSIGDLMLAAMKVLKEGFPGYDVTLFLAEKHSAVPTGEDRLPRFNYASTGSREDMVAVLNAFVLKNDAMLKADKIGDQPPTESRN